MKTAISQPATPLKMETPKRNTNENLHNATKRLSLDGKIVKKRKVNGKKDRNNLQLTVFLNNLSIQNREKATIVLQTQRNRSETGKILQKIVFEFPNLYLFLTN